MIETGDTLGADALGILVTSLLPGPGTRAEAVVALAVGRDPATTPADALSARDASWIGKAVAYQVPAGTTAL